MPRSARFTVTAEVVSAITSSLVLDEVLASIARRACEVLELWECDLYGYVAPEEQVTCLAVWARQPDPGDADWVGAKLALADHPTFRRVLKEGRILAAHLDDPGLPPADRARMEAWGERSSLLVPLIFKDEVIGCLQLIERRHMRTFSGRDRELAATLAALAALAICQRPPLCRSGGACHHRRCHRALQPPTLARPLGGRGGPGASATACPSPC